LPKAVILHCAEYVEFVNRAVCRQGFEGLIAAISDAKSRTDFVQVRASEALRSECADAGDFSRGDDSARYEIFNALAYASRSEAHDSKVHDNRARDEVTRRQ
jgi:hypothetical protein